MTLINKVYAQFRRPSGFLGRLAGWIMANRPSNIERNRWTVDLLGASPSNRCDSHVASCCAPTRVAAALGDGHAGVWHVPERDDSCRLRRRDDTA